MQRILVLGGSGFVGRHVCEKLSQLGGRVTVPTRHPDHGKTVLTLRQLHPTKAQRDAGVAFGAVEIGNGTLDKLAEHLAT